MIFRRMAGRVALTGVVAAFGAGVIAFAVYNPGRAGGYNTTAEHFILPHLGQPGTVSLADLAGRPLVVEFFASQCSECPNELDVIAADARAKRGRIDFLAIDTLDSGNGAEQARHHLPSSITAVARDVGGSNGDGLYEALGGTGTLPLTAFYSPRGILLATHPGRLDARALAAEMAHVFGTSST